MFRKAMLAAACAAFTCVACGETDGPVDANEALTEAVAAMGAENVDSITYSGSAKRIRNSFMQTPNASPPWPTFDISNYQRTIDLTQPASRASGNEFHGGLFMGPPTDQPYTQNIASDSGWANQLEIWLTPWGFLRGAQMNNAEAESQMVDGTRYTIVTWMTPESLTSPSGMRYTVRGYINDQNLVEIVETWVEDQIMGDLHVRNVYSDYRDFDGVMVPTRMVQERAGGMVFEVAVEDASANPENLAELMTPPAPAGGGPGGRGGRGGRAGGPGGPGRGGRGAAPAPTELAEKAGDGVYLIGGGYVALAVEFTDHVAVFEAGQSPARGQQILDEVKRVIPNKPIRYIINSHPHSDHSMGLAPFIREGATLITHSNNVEFFEMAFTAPRTLLGEDPMMPMIEGVDDMRVLEDDMNRLELHSVPNDHTDGMLVAYLPKQKILFQADFTLPQPGAAANPFVVTLAERVQELDLDFDRYLAVHAAQQPQTKDDLMAALKQ